jgi:hypothetical protein
MTLQQSSYAHNNVHHDEKMQHMLRAQQCAQRCKDAYQEMRIMHAHTPKQSATETAQCRCIAVFTSKFSGWARVVLRTS